jgi:hypothetical protein
MDLNTMITLPYWNELAGKHLPEIVMILTAGVVALVDRYIRRVVGRATSSINRVLRFLVFLLTCSVGYAALALGVAWGLRTGLTYSGGIYMAPVVLGIVLIVAIEAQRQKVS